jgi:hypothetical protein
MATREELRLFDPMKLLGELMENQASPAAASRLDTALGRGGLSAPDNPLQQLLGSLAAQASVEQADNTPLLMKAAEHMAIRFALERFQKGEVKVNAVHQMMEHMSRQMDTLRQILKLQEDKMSKAGILVESHADILDRMFWAEVPESGKKHCHPTLVGGSNVVNILMVVVFPAPFGPRNAKISPLGTSNEMSLTACVRPNDRCRCRISIVRLQFDA